MKLVTQVLNKSFVGRRKRSYTNAREGNLCVDEPPR